MTVPFLVGSDQGDPDRGEVAARRTTVTLARSAVTQAYSRFAVLPILLGVLILAQIEDGSFLTWSSIQLTLQQNAPLGIIAVGLTFVLIGGGIDISVGALYAAGASVYAKIALHHSLILAFAAAVAAGIVAGTVNGLLVTRLKFNPFVATLGTASLFGGLVVVYAGNQALVPHNPAFGDLGNNSLGGVAYVVIILVATFLIGSLALHRTSYGKSLFAIGGSFGASHLAGLRVDLYRLFTYVISGTCAAVAGVIYASQIGLSESGLGGNLVALTAIAIVVLGGTSLFGGDGAMWRTIVGFTILASITTIFTVLAITQPVQEMIEGGIVVAALILDAAARNRSAV
jgi:ribose transport system permease protein